MNIDDEQLKRDQENVSRAYAKTNSPGDMPSSVIDDAIRAAARRAVHAGPAPIGKSWVRRWAPQIAVAATVVLTVSVVFVAIDERPDLAPAPVTKMATMADAAKHVPMEAKVVAELAAPQRAATNRPVVQLPLAVPAIPAPEAQITGATDSLRPTAEAAFEKKTNRADANVSPVPPPPAKLEARRERATDEAVAVNTPATPPLVAPPAPRPAQTAAPPAQAVAKSVAEAPASAAKETKIAEGVTSTPVIVAAKPARASDSGAATSARQSSQAGAIATTAPAAATPPTVIASPIPPQAARAPSAATVAPSAAPLAPQVSAGLRGFSSDLDEKKSKLADKRDEESADAWIKRMTEMKAQGKLKELREDIVRFKKRYPDRLLPKELAELPAE